MVVAAIPFPNFSPEIFTIDIGAFSFALRWYALAYIVGIVIGWRLVVMALARPYLWRDDSPPMAREQVDDLLTWMILGIIIGGRLGFVLFYQPEYYAANPLEVLKVWQGGMAFHGGFLGVVVAGLLWCWRSGVAMLPVADALALATPPGLLLGRVANFINAELWGAPTDMPWGVIFPGPLAQACPGAVPGTCARHPSQLYEAGLEGLVLGAVLLWLVFGRRWLRRPGAVLGVFLTGYGLARMLVEVWRQSDAQFITPDNPEGWVWRMGEVGLSMGQVLSLPMVAAGLIALAVAFRPRR